MKLVAPTDVSLSRPFRITDGKSETGPRLGGRAPVGVGDGVLRPDARYVLTIPFDDAGTRELSLFAQGDLWDAMNAGLCTDDRIVPVVHTPSGRRADGRFRSALSEHRLELGEVQGDDDPERNAPGPRADHKLGGRPYCIQEPELPGAAELLSKGAVQLLQLDFPSARDGAVSGSWPFADGMFNLFGAAPFSVFWWAFQK